MGLWESLAGIGSMVGGGLLTATGVGAPIGLGVMGAGAGLLKHSLASDTENDDKYIASETQRYAPLTHMATPAIRRAGNVMGDVFQGGMTGAALGQGLASMAAPAAVSGAATAGGANLGVLPAATSGANLLPAGASGGISPGSFWGLQGGLSTAAPLVPESAGMVGAGMSAVPQMNYWEQLRKAGGSPYSA